MVGNSGNLTFSIFPLPLYLSTENYISDNYGNTEKLATKIYKGIDCGGGILLMEKNWKSKNYSCKYNYHKYILVWVNRIGDKQSS